MDQLTEELTVNDHCKQMIIKAGKQYNVMAALFAMLNILTFSIDIPRLYRHWNLDLPTWFDIYSFKVYYVLIILYMVIVSAQMYKYFKAVKLQCKAIKQFSQAEFDESFKYYVDGNRYGIIAYSMYIPMELVVLYSDFFIP